MWCRSDGPAAVADIAGPGAELGPGAGGGGGGASRRTMNIHHHLV